MMELTNKELVKILEESLRVGFDIDKIAWVASKAVNDMYTSKEQADILHSLAMMTMGPEFEMTEAQLRALIDRIRGT